MTTRGPADTSVIIAREAGRRLEVDRLPDVLAISVITLGELRAGVLSATSSGARAQRLDTLGRAMSLDVMPVDIDVAAAWAELRSQAPRRGAEDAGEPFLDSGDGDGRRSTRGDPGSGLRHRWRLHVIQV